MDKENKNKESINLDKVKQLIKDNKVWVLSGVVILVLVIAIIAILSTNSTTPNTGDKSNSADLNQNQEEPVVIPDDVDKIQEITDSVNKTEIETISNRNNEQAEIILETIGIDIKQINSYSCNIDPKQDSAHAIMILRPKEEYFQDISTIVSVYCGNKQSYFIDKGKEDTDLCKIAKNALVCELHPYIIVVMEEDASAILDTIISKLDIFNNTDSMEEELIEGAEGSN